VLSKELYFSCRRWAVTYSIFGRPHNGSDNNILYPDSIRDLTKIIEPTSVISIRRQVDKGWL